LRATEIESGRSKDRPQLKEALRVCRVYNAKLIIARLDRLARSVSMIAGLLESDVDFIAADMPLANRFTIHRLAPSLLASNPASNLMMWTPPHRPAAMMPSGPQRDRERLQ
jgi:hypothetical protein